MKTLSTKLTIIRPLVLLGVIVATLGVVQAVSALQSPATPAAASYKHTLQAQVDTATGAPQNGRNPATQAQTSLAAAASQPNGIGKQVDKPAAGITGSMRHTDPASVLPNPKKTGVLASGCLINYGDPGVQCLPAYVKNGSKSPDCATIQKLFKNGVKVNGTDTLRLDKNHDNIACDASDALLPNTP
jgi:hypothetical protein